jgi:hypothetical protein
MISILLQGGLGNQLFQLFTAISYALDQKEKIVIPTEKIDGHNRPTYWTTLLKRLKESVEKVDVKKIQKLAEAGFHYTPLPFVPNVMLVGYFQSYKYFDAYKGEILKEIGYENIADDFKKKLNNHFNPCEMVSLHFRIGDIIKVHKDNNIIIPVDYYINAMKHIETVSQYTNIKLLYFCEAEDNEYVLTNYINPLKELFPNTSYYKASDTLEDWEQLVLMSLCEHHILANSTFSWWGAYLATDTDNKNKRNLYLKTVKKLANWLLVQVG